MSLLDWFNARPAEAFGAALAGTFAQSVPIDADLTERRFSQKAEAALKKMDRLVADFKRTNKLNIYTKAQLGNSFKWSLKDSGFEDAYVNRLAEWLVARL